MTDVRMMSGLSGHTHWGSHETSPAMELDGVLTVVSVDHEAVLWTCDLLGGDCVQRPLDLDAAGPEDDWYHESGLWEGDDGEEDERPAWEAEAVEIASVVTVAHLDGVPVIVTGGGQFDLSHPDLETLGGGVRVWDLRTGRKIGKTLTGHGLGISTLTTVPFAQGVLAVSSSEEGRLLAWNLADGARVADLQGSYNGGMGAALVGDRPIAVTGGDDDFLQAWDLLSAERLGEPLTGIEPVVRAIAITEVDGRAMVVAGGDDQLLHAWDLTTSEPIGSPMAGHTDSIQTLGTATVDGRTVVVTGSDDGTTRIWDLARGEQIGDPITGHTLQAVTELAGTPVAVTIGRDTGSGDVIRAWDLTRTAR